MAFLKQNTCPSLVVQLLQMLEQGRKEVDKPLKDSFEETPTVPDVVFKMFLLCQQQARLEVEALRKENKLLKQDTAKLSSEVESLRHNLQLTTHALNDVLTVSERHTGLTETARLQRERELARARAQDFLATRSGTSRPSLLVTVESPYSQHSTGDEAPVIHPKAPAPVPMSLRLDATSSSSEYPYDTTDGSASEAQSEASVENHPPRADAPSASSCHESAEPSYSSLASAPLLLSNKKSNTNPAMSFGPPYSLHDVQTRDIPSGTTARKPYLNAEHHSTDPRTGWRSDVRVPASSSRRNAGISQLEMRKGSLLPPMDRDQEGRKHAGDHYPLCDVQTRDISLGTTVRKPCMNAEHHSTDPRTGWHSDVHAPATSSRGNAEISQLEMHKGSLLPPMHTEQVGRRHADVHHWQNVQTRDVSPGRADNGPYLNAEHHSTDPRTGWHSDVHATAFSSRRNTDISQLEMHKGSLLPPRHRETGGSRHPIDHELHHLDSEGPPSYSNRHVLEHFPRLKLLDSLAKDMEPFNPASPNYHVEDYLKEIERSLSDLPYATEQEKVKLIWKTTSRSVHTFIESQPFSIRDSYTQLCKALAEEYSPFFDEASAFMSAINIKHKRSEHPRDYFNRLKQTFFQGRNGPGLTEDRTFKSLFLHNLHPCVRTHVTLLACQGDLSMREIRKTTQTVWETVVQPSMPGGDSKGLQDPPYALPLKGDVPGIISAHSSAFSMQ
ncbi:uncharacterized protein LOC143510013 [Brachyhypopomus gauderio]|uniref:uncharacterized protein LOC143510013 n=1 Tax=Brachyhypopomus gauderio TaxID=698409 RepID=UPI004041BCD6